MHRPDGVRLIGDRVEGQQPTSEMPDGVRLIGARLEGQQSTSESLQ
jgi:hypothetical protein